MSKWYSNFLVATAISFLMLLCSHAEGWRFRPLRKLADVVVGVSIIISAHQNVFASSGKERFELALSELRNLDTNWDSIVKGNGDNIRRKLGTVYTPPSCDSPLCSFSTYFDEYIMSHEDLDISALEGPSFDLKEALGQADFLAYSSIFSEYGNGGGGANYIADSRVQVTRAMELMKTVIDIIDVK